MIIDQVPNAALYRGLSPLMAAAMDELLKGELPRRADGRYELRGDRLVAIVQTYPTKPRSQGAWETHRKYIDVQWMLQGEELMGYGPVDELKVAQVYDSQKDVMFHEGEGRGFVRVSAGMFVIFHPHDAHMPSLTAQTPSTVRKIVLKVAAE